MSTPSSSDFPTEVTALPKWGPSPAIDLYEAYHHAIRKSLMITRHPKTVGEWMTEWIRENSPHLAHLLPEDRQIKVEPVDLAKDVCKLTAHPITVDEAHHAPSPQNKEPVVADKRTLPLTRRNFVNLPSHIAGALRKHGIKYDSWEFGDSTYFPRTTNHTDLGALCMRGLVIELILHGEHVLGGGARALKHDPDSIYDWFPSVAEYLECHDADRYQWMAFAGRDAILERAAAWIRKQVEPHMEALHRFESRVLAENRAIDNARDKTSPEQQIEVHMDFGMPNNSNKTGFTVGSAIHAAVKAWDGKKIDCPISVSCYPSHDNVPAKLPVGLFSAPKPHGADMADKSARIAHGPVVRDHVNPSAMSNFFADTVIADRISSMTAEINELKQQKAKLQAENERLRAAEPSAAAKGELSQEGWDAAILDLIEGAAVHGDGLSADLAKGTDSTLQRSRLKVLVMMGARELCRRRISDDKFRERMQEHIKSGFCSAEEATMAVDRERAVKAFDEVFYRLGLHFTGEEVAEILNEALEVRAQSETAAAVQADAERRDELIERKPVRRLRRDEEWPDVKKAIDDAYYAVHRKR